MYSIGCYRSSIQAQQRLTWISVSGGRSDAYWALLLHGHNNNYGPWRYYLLPCLKVNKYAPVIVLQHYRFLAQYL